MTRPPPTSSGADQAMAITLARIGLNEGAVTPGVGELVLARIYPDGRIVIRAVPLTAENRRALLRPYLFDREAREGAEVTLDRIADPDATIVVAISPPSSRTIDVLETPAVPQRAERAGAA